LNQTVVQKHKIKIVDKNANGSDSKKVFMQQINSSSLPATIRQNEKTMIKTNSGKSNKKDNKLGIEDVY
jgi:hypothetical protein